MAIVCSHEILDLGRRCRVKVVAAYEVGGQIVCREAGDGFGGSIGLGHHSVCTRDSVHALGSHDLVFGDVFPKWIKFKARVWSF